jgi:hypothetical protein
MSYHLVSDSVWLNHPSQDSRKVENSTAHSAYFRTIAKPTYRYGFVLLLLIYISLPPT